MKLYKRNRTVFWYRTSIALGILIWLYTFLLFMNTYTYDIVFTFYCVMGLLFILYGASCLKRKQNVFKIIPKGIRKGCMILISIILIIFIILEGLIVAQGLQKEVGKSGYIIVLGALVRGDEITKTLQYRLDAAITMHKQNPDLIIVVSGGQGENEKRSEAYYMKEYLLEHGVAKKQIRMEDKSRDTYENMKYSKAIIDQETNKIEVPITIISNSFHMYRAKYLAKQVGFKEIYTYGTKSHALTSVHYYIRESIGLVKDFVVHH